MNVVRAHHAGACYGVQRALDMAYAALCDGGRVFTLGPLIHNPQVVAKLAMRGLAAVDSLDEIDDGLVIIRSHGVVPQIKCDAEERGFTVVDATCPHVARAQKAVAALAEEGYHVIVVGEVGHPEVAGLVAHAPDGSAIVVATPDELPENLETPIGIVVQTTQSPEALEAVVSALRARGIEPLVKNTICFATRQRQAAVAELANSVDALVVIGGRNSSNTTRLYDICRALCPRSYHIESFDEIDPSWFEGCTNVGVSAGASTPEDQIDSVVEYLVKL